MLITTQIALFSHNKALWPIVPFPEPDEELSETCWYNLIIFLYIFY